MSSNDVGREAPLRIAFLDSNLDWGGGQKWCVESARALVARGHAVRVCCQRGSALEERARAAGLEVWSAPLRGLSRLRSTVALARWLRRERTELVIANAGRDLRMAALAGTFGGPALVQRRGIARAIRRDPISRWIYGRSVARVIANCEAIRSTMLRGTDFVDPARFVVIQNGIDASAFEPPDRTRARALLGIAPDVPLAGCVGRLAPMKGHAHLLRAWTRVRARVPGATLVLAGEGSQGDDLKRLAQELALDDSVRFLGFIRDPRELYGALDLFVLPSVRDEGCSNALLEAMAQGLAAVVTSAGGLAEPVLEGCTGLVVPPGDAQRLAAALIALLADPARRSAMGSAARERATERYDFERGIDELERLLRGVRSDRARGAGSRAREQPS